MPRNIISLALFVACPSDLQEERSLLEEVIQEQNPIWTRNFGVQIEPIFWETYVFSSFGSDAQDAINSQVEDYDLFLGMLWGRFGTPTKRFGSGTEEEFERAYTKLQRGEEKFNIFFYEKNAPIEPSKIDIDQLKKVKDFQQRLAQLGSLSKQFNSPDDFKRTARLDFSLYLQKNYAITARIIEPSASPIQVQVEISKSSTATESSSIQDLELGYLDHVIDFMERVEELKNFAVEGTKIMTSFREGLMEKTKILRELLSVKNIQNFIKARKIVDEAADHFNQVGDQLEEVYVDISSKLALAIDSLQKSLDKGAKQSSSWETTKQEIQPTLAKLKTTFSSNRSGISRFRSTVESTPDTTAHFIKAKKRLASVIEKYEENFIKAENTIDQVLL